MKTERWMQEELKAAKPSFEFRLETLMIELGESITCLMNAHHLTRTELARRLGVSKPYITKILNGKPNVTLETLLKLSDALEGELKLGIVPKKVPHRPRVRATDSVSTSPRRRVAVGIMAAK